MKPIILIFISLLAGTNSQSQSIHFENLTLRAALAKAKAEKKPLFIEMYTTWCTYCRQMDRDVFTQNETGDYYNTHFINVRYDAMEGNGVQVRQSYSLLGFPTHIYLNPDGLVLLKTAGFQEPDTFIANADSAVRKMTGKAE